MQKSEDGRQCCSTLRECVEECSRRLSEAVERTDADVGLHHPLHTLLQPPAAQQCPAGALTSVISDEPFVAHEALADGNYAVAVCTPLMKRVHRLVPQAADVVVVDAGQPVDKRRQCRVVVLVTSSSAGGLPLGVIAASSDASLQRAVQLYASMLDSRCFYGRGPPGPTLFLVDDCPTLRTAFAGVFTASAYLLCTYRLLLSYWRELWDRRSAVGTEHRPRCFALFRAALFADTVDQLHARFADVQGDCVTVSCASTQSHAMAVYERRAEWSVCCQKLDWPALSCVRTVGANRGLCVYASRTLKDAVVEYAKSMKTLETLLTFVSRRCDSYYERRLVDTLAGRLVDASALRFMHDCDVSARVVSTLPPSQFDVTLQPLTGASNVNVGGDCLLTGATATCHVELSVGLCTCSVGCGGGSCVHQWAAVLQTHARSWFIRPVTSTAAQRLVAHIATGLGCAEASWFASLHPLQSSCEDTLMLSDDSDIGVAERSVTAEQAVEVRVAAPQCNDVDSLPPTVVTTDVTDNKHLIINWNGLAYEVSLQEQETLIMEPNDTLTTSSAAVGTPLRDRLRQSLSKIEAAYLSHPDLMETAVSAFCQTVESVEVIEHLNSALLCFGNSFMTSVSAPPSWS